MRTMTRINNMFFGNLMMIKYENPSTSYETHVRVCRFYGKRVPQLKIKLIGSRNAVVVYLPKEYIGCCLFLCVRKWITNNTTVPTSLPLLPPPPPPPTTTTELAMITLISISLLILCIVLFTNVSQTQLLRSTHSHHTVSMIAV